MSESIETIGNSLVKHGPRHDLAQLIKLHPADAPEIIDKLEQLAGSRGYSKVSTKVPAAEAGRFVTAGYHLEATIPRFFPEGGSACFMAKYFSADRKLERQPLLVREVLIAADAQRRAVVTPLPARYALRMVGEEDADEMAEFRRQVLAAKQPAIHDPGNIIGGAAREKSHLNLFGLWRGESIVALSCAEMDFTSSSAEMTYFATLPEYRGQGLSLHLLQQMEEKLLTLGIRSIFAITRAYSFGRNIIFARNGYSFGGTLTNNTNSCGILESVNVWHKALPDDPRFAWRHLFEVGNTEDGSDPGSSA